MIQKYGAYIVLLSSLLSPLVAANEEEKTMNHDETAVLQAIETMTSAFIKKDIGGVIASYEDEAAVMFEPTVKITDPNQIRQMFEGMFQVNPVFEYPQGHEVYITNDIALHIAPWVMTAQTPDGTPIEQSGLSVAVLRKQADGKWLLIIDNPHGQQLLQSK